MLSPSKGSYTPMETLFPLLVAALEVFNWYGLQHVCYNRKNKCFELLDRIANEQGFFSSVITEDESWIFLNTILRPRGKVSDGGVGLQIWRLAANILNKQSWTAEQEWPSSLEVWREVRTSHCKNHLRSETSHRASELDWSLGTTMVKKCTPTGWRPLRRPSRRWEDNIRMDLKEIGINTRI